GSSAMQRCRHLDLTVTQLVQAVSLAGVHVGRGLETISHLVDGLKDAKIHIQPSMRPCLPLRPAKSLWRCVEASCTHGFSGKYHKEVCSQIRAPLDGVVQGLNNAGFSVGGGSARFLALGSTLLGLLLPGIAGYRRRSFVVFFATLAGVIAFFGITHGLW